LVSRELGSKPRGIKNAPFNKGSRGLNVMNLRFTANTRLHYKEAVSMPYRATAIASETSNHMAKGRNFVVSIP
jgi:hypothetical protein